MKRRAGIVFVLMGVAVSAAAQAPHDRCHVYVVDVAAAEKAAALDDEQAMIKAAQAAQTMFPEFAPEVSEEALTTKHYAFPGAKQFITASVYYTDESMSSAVGSDSIVLGVALAPRELRDAISADASGGAMAETSLGDRMGKVRAKHYVTVNGKEYLVGIECDCSRSAPAKP